MKTKIKTFIWNHGPTIFIAFLIFIFSSIPRLVVPDIGFSLQDKFFHFLEFGSFGFFLQRSFCKLQVSLYKSIIMVFFIGSAYGVLNEVHQSIIPGRVASLSDIIANSIGIVCFQIFFLCVRKN